jgi:hypothetical protein
MAKPTVNDLAKSYVKARNKFRDLRARPVLETAQSEDAKKREDLSVQLTAEDAIHMARTEAEHRRTIEAQSAMTKAWEALAKAARKELLKTEGK